MAVMRGDRTSATRWWGLAVKCRLLCVSNAIYISLLHKSLHFALSKSWGSESMFRAVHFDLSGSRSCPGYTFCMPFVKLRNSNIQMIILLTNSFPLESPFVNVIMNRALFLSRPPNLSGKCTMPSGCCAQDAAKSLQLWMFRYVSISSDPQVHH